MSASANHIAYTCPINPLNNISTTTTTTTIKLTRAQVWSGLLLKIKSAESFVGGAIISTTVIDSHTDSAGNPVTVRDVLFKGAERPVRETVTAYQDCRVDFFQQDTGGVISNIVSDGGDQNGEELYMTYCFEWRHPGSSEEELKVCRVKELKMAKMAVLSTLLAMREMVADGRIKG